MLPASLSEAPAGECGWRERKPVSHRGAARIGFLLGRNLGLNFLNREGAGAACIEQLGILLADALPR